MTSPSSLQISAVQKQIVRVRRTTPANRTKPPRALPMKGSHLDGHHRAVRQAGTDRQAMAASSTDINTPPWNCCR